MNKLPISIGILSWHSGQTLVDTLFSYYQNSLFEITNDVTILFQEVTDEDKQIADHFGIKYIGLNDNIVEGLAVSSNNPMFAYDSYRRLIQMYSSVVLNIDNEKFDHVLYKQNKMLSLSIIKDTIDQFKDIVLECTGKTFPQDVTEQLISSISAVFRSWNSYRATVYRNKN